MELGRAAAGDHGACDVRAGGGERGDCDGLIGDGADAERAGGRGCADRRGRLARCERDDRIGDGRGRERLLGGGPCGRGAGAWNASAVCGQCDERCGGGCERGDGHVHDAGGRADGASGDVCGARYAGDGGGGPDDAGHRCGGGERSDHDERARHLAGRRATGRCAGRSRRCGHAADLRHRRPRPRT